MRARHARQIRAGIGWADRGMSFIPVEAPRLVRVAYYRRVRQLLNRHKAAAA